MLIRLDIPDEGEPTPSPAPASGARPKCAHPNAKDDGECSEGCCDRYVCPDCGKRWTEEAPQ